METKKDNRLRNLNIARYVALGIFFLTALADIWVRKPWGLMYFFVALGVLFVLEIYAGRSRSRLSFIEGQLDAVDQIQKEMEAKVFHLKGKGKIESDAFTVNDLEPDGKKKQKKKPTKRKRR